MPVTIALYGARRLAGKFERAQRLEILRPPMVRALARLEDPIKTYPPPPAPGVWAAHTSKRQKRAFFALLRAGRITGKRTGTLGRRWTSKITEKGVNLEGEWGNITGYGRFVQGEETQARFHRGRWITDQQVIDQNRRAIVNDFSQAITAALEE
jgi:hypothetical protein